MPDSGGAERIRKTESNEKDPVPMLQRLQLRLSIGALKIQSLLNDLALASAKVGVGLEKLQGHGHGVDHHMEIATDLMYTQTPEADLYKSQLAQAGDRIAERKEDVGIRQGRRIDPAVNFRERVTVVREEWQVGREEVREIYRSGVVERRVISRMQHLLAPLYMHTGAASTSFKEETISAIRHALSEIQEMNPEVQPANAVDGNVLASVRAYQTVVERNLAQLQQTLIEIYEQVNEAVAVIEKEEDEGGYTNQELVRKLHQAVSDKEQRLSTLVSFRDTLHSIADRSSLEGVLGDGPFTLLIQNLEIVKRSGDQLSRAEHLVKQMELARKGLRKARLRKTAVKKKLASLETKLTRAQKAKGAR